MAKSPSKKGYWVVMEGGWDDWEPVRLYKTEKAAKKSVRRKYNQRVHWNVVPVYEEK